VVLRRSIRMSCPVLFLGRAAVPRAPDVILERTPRQVLPEAAIRSSAGGSGLFLSAAKLVREHRLAAARSGPPVFLGFAGPCIQRPNATGPFSAHFHAPKSPGIQGKQALHPLPQPADGVVILEPFWERPAGTQTHSRRTVLKLGQLRDARQGLVRVPESNTKYGGKRRKTGVSPRLLLSQVSVSPQGFPSEKNLFGQPVFDCARCSQARYFLRPWACPWETHVRLRSGPGWYPRQPVV